MLTKIFHPWFTWIWCCQGCHIFQGIQLKVNIKDISHIRPETPRLAHVFPKWSPDAFQGLYCPFAELELFEVGGGQFYQQVFMFRYPTDTCDPLWLYLTKIGQIKPLCPFVTKCDQKMLFEGETLINPELKCWLGRSVSTLAALLQCFDIPRSSLSSKFIC